MTYLVDDFYVRILRDSPKHRNVHFEIVGLGRCGWMNRREFERKARAA